MITYKGNPMQTNEDFIDAARDIDDEFADALENWLYKLTDKLGAVQDAFDDLVSELDDASNAISNAKEFAESMKSNIEKR